MHSLLRKILDSCAIPWWCTPSSEKSWIHPWVRYYSWSLKFFDVSVQTSEFVTVTERVHSLEILYSCTWGTLLLPGSSLAWETIFFYNFHHQYDTDTNTFYCQNKWRIILWSKSPAFRHVNNCMYWYPSIIESQLFRLPVQLSLYHWNTPALYTVTGLNTWLSLNNWLSFP